MAVYAAMIDRLDQNIGKILKKVKELNKEKNTIIIFASDNGASAQQVAPKYLQTTDPKIPIGSMTRWTSLGKNWANVCNTPYRYFKDYSHEGGICTPLIIKYPGKTDKSNITKYPTHFIDIMSTIIDICNAKYPTTYKNKPIYPHEGTSLLPIINNPQITDRKKPLFWKWKNEEAILNGKWKIVRYKNQPWELYNMKNDPCENNNLAKQFPHTVKKLSKQFFQWKRDTK